MENVRIPLIEDIEKVINELSDITSCKIIYDENGTIEEIHILSTQRRSPKQISRDVQSLLINQFDMQIDHKKISVAQLKTKGKIESNYRFSIVAIGYCSVDTFVEIKVILQREDQQYEATIKGANTKNNVYRLVVQATLECVHNFLDRKDIFVVEDIVKINIANQEIINIAITNVSETREDLLIGAALLRKNDYEAIVKATLDAINRRLVQISI